MKRSELKQLIKEVIQEVTMDESMNDVKSAFLMAKNAIQTGYENIFVRSRNIRGREFLQVLESYEEEIQELIDKALKLTIAAPQEKKAEFEQLYKNIIAVRNYLFLLMKEVGNKINTEGNYKVGDFHIDSELKKLDAMWLDISLKTKKLVSGK